MKTNMIRKTLALLLAVLTVISCVPVSALISATSDTGSAVSIAETQPTETPADPRGSASDEIEYEAVSGTMNIVGEVLANAFNSVDEEPEKRAARLEVYPREEHEPSYYEGTLRLRYLNDGGDKPNYLVYRDTFLIIPEEEAANYTIEYSGDGHTAFVSPALPGESLADKTGVIFLRENIGLDEILVFGGEPQNNGGTLTVPLKNTDDIAVTELFSDGKLEYDGSAADEEDTRVSVDFDRTPSGTNWSGEITSFEPSWPTANVHVDVWDLEFQLILNLRFDMDFEIETTGSSHGRESATIAGVHIPIKLFTINVIYKLQAEFSETPLEMKGTLTTDMDITMDLIRGIRISKYRNPVRFSELKIRNGNAFNRDIQFYIGSELLIQGGFLEINIDLWLFSVHIGPVLSLNLSNSGGCHVTFRHEKDTFNPQQTGQNSIHTCSAQGESGCLSVHLREVTHCSIYFKIDLYFDDWVFTFYDPGEQTIGERDYYNSYTFSSGWRDGLCPHHLYKVPVAVWNDDAMTQPVSGANVTVADDVFLTEAEYVYLNGVTGAYGIYNGKTYIYLPYREDYRYTLVGSKSIDGTVISGSALQPEPINTETNPTVNIVLKQDDLIKLHIVNRWVIDAEEHDRPNYLEVVIQRRTDRSEPWVKVDSFYLEDSNNWSHDYYGDKVDVVKGKLYEYRAVLYNVFPAEGTSTAFTSYRVNAYTTIGTEAEPDHLTQYYVEYSSVPTDEGFDITITETAMVSVTLNKRWDISDEETGAVPVYLVLEQKPANGWREKARERLVPTEWTPIIHPFSGDTTSIRELVDLAILDVESVPAIEDVPLSIGRVSQENNWRTTFTVPKYRNGIKMQFIGSELDGGAIRNLLKNEYDVNVVASVAPFGDFESEYGQPFVRFTNGWEYVIDVLNHDVNEHKIGGTIEWFYDRSETPNVEKLSVNVHVFDENGEEVQGSPVFLDRAQNSSDCWIWSITGDDIDSSREYTITEEFVGTTLYGYTWKPIINGLNAGNYHRAGNNTSLIVKAVFENASESDDLPEGLAYTISDAQNHSWSGTLWANDNYRYIGGVPTPGPVTVTLPEIEGWVAEYKAPEFVHYYWDALYYLVIYRRQMPVRLRITKFRDANGDPSVFSPGWFEADVFRNGELIKTVRLERRGTAYREQIVETDQEGNQLMRLAPDGTRYEYTVVERKTDGFTPSVSMEETVDSGLDIVTLRITNTWIGADRINVVGTVSWEGDEGHEDLRPESVQISVVNSRDEYVRTLTVPVSNGTFRARYLPSKDESGNELRYAVLESHVRGYTASYSEPVFDENTGNWTCNITNKLTGYTTINVKKAIEGHPGNENEAYSFHIEPNTEADNGEHEFPEPLHSDITINGAGEKKAEFIIDENGLYLYSFKETKGEAEGCVYDETERLVLIVRTTDSDGSVKFRSWVGKKGDDIAPTDDMTCDTVTFTNVYPNLTVEKKWDIDLEEKDRPDSIEAVVQKKKDGKWETVKLVKLDDDNDWKASLYIEGYSSGSSDYRVRELREETALQELGGRMRELIVQGKEKYDEWISILRTEGKTYWDSLPEDIRNAADEGYDPLLDKLGTTPNNLYEKLMELLSFASADARIVYDEDDSDKGETTNEVTYHVDEYVSVLSGCTEDAHVTKYKVSYDKSGNTFIIKNMAILEIDVIKRWIGIGVDDDDMPDSAWVVLMCSPKEGALDSASDLASAAGIDIGGVLDYEFPVINPEEGGKDALTLLSELSIGLDVSMIGKIAEKIFGIKIPKLAVAKVDEDCDWKAEFVLSKYNCGVPMDYKGAELWSEIIRQIIKYLIGFSLPVSFNPFDGYISIPTKAIPTILGIENPEDILDLSGLAGKALEKAKSLTMDDISNFGWSTVVDDYHLMANVINIKIDWDHDDDDTLSGSKFWADDDEDKRPDYILIHVKDADGDIEGSPITLRKSEFAGQDEWTWSIDKPEDASPFTYYYVSEEYPASYEYKDDYTCEIDGLDITNTWHKENFTISGTKIWQDGNDADGIRPETVTIRLLADGVEVASAVTSRAGDWKYFFPNQPKTKDGREITYTVAEDPVPGYETKIDGYNVINTHYSGVLRISVTRSAEDAAREQSFIFAVEGPDGENALSLEVMIVLAAGETSASAVIKALPTGNYTVKEHSDWSWRYGAASAQTAMVELGKTAEVSFGEAVENRYWLDGCGSDGSGSAVAASFTHTAAILPDTDEDKKRYRQNV